MRHIVDEVGFYLSYFFLCKELVQGYTERHQDDKREKNRNHNQPYYISPNERISVGNDYV